MKYISSSLLCVLAFMLTINVSNANTGLLPDGKPLTIDNLETYKRSTTGSGITIRKGAKMKDTMNYKDCHEPSYNVCIDWGPCSLKVFGIGIDIPSFGINFEYWEPNAVVETVCNQSNSYYEDDMNLSSRIVGSKRILGKGATIAGLPAEKCIETIKRSGGMEGAGALPRFFNEAHVWGVGLLPRYYSSATPIEATVSSICGYGGLVGGLFSVFSGSAGSSDVMDGGMGEMADTDMAMGIVGGGESSWMGDLAETYTSASEGFESFTGMGLTKTLKIAAAVGSGAMATMEKNSEKEVRSDTLCKQKMELESASDKSAELKDITDKPDFNLDMFTAGYDDGGSCPIGVKYGHTLGDDPLSFRGVKEVNIPFTSSCSDKLNGDGGFSKDWTCLMGESSARSASGNPRVSQVQISGLYPACKGYPATDLKASPVMEEHTIHTDNSLYTLKGFDVAGLGFIVANNQEETIGNIINMGTTRFGQNRNFGIVTCTNRIINDNSSDDSGVLGSTTTQSCVVKKETYVEALDHRKQLNQYLADSIEDTFTDSGELASGTLESVNKRIADLGGDCTSDGKVSGEWGDAIIKSAATVAAVEGMTAGIEYIQNSPAYNSLKDKAAEYAEGVMSNFVQEQAEEIVTDMATEQLTDGILEEMDISSFMEENLNEFLPGLIEESGLEGSVAEATGDSGFEIGEAMDYFKTAMDIAKVATYDGALKQAALGIASSYDPTGLWPGFTSEMSALSWRGKNIPQAQQIQGMLGIKGHLPCAVGVIAEDLGIGSMVGSFLSSTEDWLGCVGTWGPVEPKTGFVFHRDSKVAGALAGYRGYQLAVNLNTIEEHPTSKAGEPMKINLDYPHQTECFIPGTADPRWESKDGLLPTEALESLKNTAFNAATGATGDADGMVFTYWRKTKCCLFLVGYYGTGYRVCWEVEREY